MLRFGKYKMFSLPIGSEELQNPLLLSPFSLPNSERLLRKSTTSPSGSSTERSKSSGVSQKSCTWICGAVERKDTQFRLSLGLTLTLRSRRLVSESIIWKPVIGKTKHWSCKKFHWFFLTTARVMVDHGSRGILPTPKKFGLNRWRNPRGAHLEIGTKRSPKRTFASPVPVISPMLVCERQMYGVVAKPGALRRKNEALMRRNEFPLKLHIRNLQNWPQTGTERWCVEIFSLSWFCARRSKGFLGVRKLRKDPRTSCELEKRITRGHANNSEKVIL